MKMSASGTAPAPMISADTAKAPRQSSVSMRYWCRIEYRMPPAAMPMPMTPMACPRRRVNHLATGTAVSTCPGALKSTTPSTKKSASTTP